MRVSGGLFEEMLAVHLKKYLFKDSPILKNHLFEESRRTVYLFRHAD
jgi:hypothetical protein